MGLLSSVVSKVKSAVSGSSSKSSSSSGSSSSSKSSSSKSTPTTTASTPAKTSTSSTAKTTTATSSPASSLLSGLLSGIKSTSLPSTVSSFIQSASSQAKTSTPTASTVKTTSTSLPDWQVRLNDITGGNKQLGYDEMQRASDMWYQYKNNYDNATTASDKAMWQSKMDGAHDWKNSVANALGIPSSAYDQKTGQIYDANAYYGQRPVVQNPEVSIFDNLSVPVSDPRFAGEQMLRDWLYTHQSPLNVPSSSDMNSQAKTYADLQISPVLSAIQSKLDNAQSSYDSAKKAVESAYATVPERTQARLSEARNYALENAIARGMGRSGVVDWSTAKMSAPIVTEEAQAMAEKASKLAGLANDFASAKTEGDRLRTEAETRRGELTSGKFDELQKYYDQLRTQDELTKWSQLMSYVGLMNNADQAQMNLLGTMADRLKNG